MTKISKAGQEKQLENLRKWFPKGSTVYTILRHVSRSGMQRTISALAVLPSIDVLNLDPVSYSSIKKICFYLSAVLVGALFAVLVAR